MTELIGFSPSILDRINKEKDSPLRFRFATEDDIGVLVPLVNGAYMYENEGEKAFKQREALRTSNDAMKTTLNDGVVIVATSPKTGEIFGCVQYKEIPASVGSGSDQDINAYFGMLTVDPTFQGRAYGLRLMKAAEEIGRARGKSTIEIQVVNHSTHLLDLYGRFGYREFGQTAWNAPFLTRPTHFLLMSKSLNHVDSKQN